MENTDIVLAITKIYSEDLTYLFDWKVFIVFLSTLYINLMFTEMNVLWFLS